MAKKKKTRKKAVKRKAKKKVKKKTVKKKTRSQKEEPCPECGYKKRHIHTDMDCPMCRQCPGCRETLMACQCVEGE